MTSPEPGDGLTIDAGGQVWPSDDRGPDPVPPQAITAAAVAIHDVDCTDDRCSGSALGHCYKLARAALEAAAPHLAAAEREACAQLAESTGAVYQVTCTMADCPCPPGASSHTRPFVALLRKDDHAAT